MNSLFYSSSSTFNYSLAVISFFKTCQNILLVTVTLISFQTLGQNYEEMSPDVRIKMDQNKMDGKDLFEGVYTNFIVHVEGLTDDELTILMDRSNLNSDIIYFKIESNDKIIVTCKSGLSFDKVKPVFSELVSNISGLEQIYFLHKK